MNGAVEIPKSKWASYLDAVTRAMEDAELSIETTSEGGWSDLPHEPLALQFVAYDDRDGLFEVAGTSEAPHLPDVVRHLVEDPRRIVADTASASPGRIEDEAGDGGRTVIRLDPVPGR